MRVGRCRELEGTLASFPLYVFLPPSGYSRGHNVSFYNIGWDERKCWNHIYGQPVGTVRIWTSLRRHTIGASGS